MSARLVILLFLTACILSTVAMARRWVPLPSVTDVKSEEVDSSESPEPAKTGLDRKLDAYFAWYSRQKNVDEITAAVHSVKYVSTVGALCNARWPDALVVLSRSENSGSGPRTPGAERILADWARRVLVQMQGFRCGTTSGAR
jgi:hypothetical protein